MEVNQAIQPMATRREIVMYAPSAAIAWQNDAERRDVSLLEHDSILVGLLALRDFVARPGSTGAPSARGTILRSPYATVPYWNQGATPPAWEAIPAVGVYPAPAAGEALQWWRAVDALVWRIADLTKESPAQGPAELTADARPVAVFGDDTHATVTMPGVKFREHAETVRLTRAIVAGASAYAEQQGRAAARDVRALDAAQFAAMDAATSLRDQLANEHDAVSARGNMRAFGVLAVTIAGAYAISSMG